MTAAACRLDRIVTSETASDESTRVEDVEDFKQAVGDISRRIKEGLEEAVKELSWELSKSRRTHHFLRLVDGCLALTSERLALQGLDERKQWIAQITSSYLSDDDH